MQQADGAAHACMHACSRQLKPHMHARVTSSSAAIWLQWTRCINLLTGKTVPDKHCTARQEVKQSRISAIPGMQSVQRTRCSTPLPPGKQQSASTHIS